MFNCWYDLAVDSKRWLTVRSVSESADVISAWTAVAQGGVSPAEGIMLELDACHKSS